MTSDLRPYPEYKDSGLPWLGRVPAHWGMVRMKHLLRERNVRGYPDEPLLAATQTMGVVRKEDYENRTVVAMKDLHLLKLVEVGDFVISLRSFQGGIEHARHRGIISPAYTVLYPGTPSLHPYLASLFKSRPFIDALRLYVTGIRQGQNVDYVRLSRSSIPVPPSEERDAIAQFVDDLDRRCRRFIRNRRRLIEVLNEQKQAIINRAVTRGLDPNAPLKPSGIEWLGSIPEHWEVMSLKRVLRSLIDCEHKTAPAAEGTGFHVIRTSAVKLGKLRWSGTYQTTKDAFDQWTQRGTPEAGDVVFTREAPAGEACVVPADADVCLGQRTVLMKLKRDEYDPRFLVNMIYAGPPRFRIQLATQGSTVGHFNMDDIGWMRILKPPIEEQIAIAVSVGDQTRNVDAAIEKAEREIDLIREYRTRLIADVVTGKVDVRGLAPAEPPSADEQSDEGIDDEEMLGDDEPELVEEAADADD
ncbi:MAG: hypothetical protein NUW37_19320 [Planctomycetes bacterium]|nr:hypothetical protein [Planctomycetota bacterium]